MPFVHKQYFVCPFPVHDSVVAMQVKKYGLKANCTTIKPFHKALEGVEANATLIIAGHGVEGGAEISNGLAKHQRLWLTAEGLAQLISKVWLLPKTHGKIRLLGCQCAGFASKVALALEGYDSVAVGGYVDDKNGDGFDEKTGRGSGFSQVDLSQYGLGIRLFTKQQILEKELDWIQWFNNKGKQVNKPDFPKTLKLTD